MKQIKTYKCSFKHCQHESCEISQDEAVIVGSRYMHKDCSKINTDISDIRDLYYEKISKTVVWSQLVSVINNIIFTKKVNSGFLLFALKHCISAKMPIKSPYGLHYIIDNQRIKELWDKREAQRIVREMKEDIVPETQEISCPKFTYKDEEKAGFTSILNGGI